MTPFLLTLSLRSLSSFPLPPSMILGDRRLIGGGLENKATICSLPNCSSFYDNNTKHHSFISAYRYQKWGGAGRPLFTSFPATHASQLSLSAVCLKRWKLEAGNNSNTKGREYFSADGARGAGWSSGIPGSYKAVQCGTPLPSVAKGCGTPWSALWLLGGLFHQE